MASLMRRASASFKGSVEGHKELHQVIGAGKETKSSLRAFTRAQAELAANQCKWAHEEANPAVSDSFAKLLELQTAWTDAQQLFAQQMRENRRLFESILVQEKATDLLRKNKSKCERAERSAEKEIARLQKRGEQLGTAETKLRQARSLREMADAELAANRTEAADFKTRVVKESVEQLATAYLDLFERGNIIFECQKELAGLLPSNEAEAEQYAAAGVERSAKLVMAAREHVRTLEAEQAARAGRRVSRRYPSSSTALSPAAPLSHHKRSSSLASLEPPPYEQHDTGEVHGSSAAAHHESNAAAHHGSSAAASYCDYPDDSSSDDGGPIYSSIDPKDMTPRASNSVLRPYSVYDNDPDPEDDQDIPVYAVPNKKRDET
eukprot:m.5916 g.5916  ORF g.5916 m.5916 type:complete len:379 (-) comp2497_c0_seq1:264-1400(-)